MHAYVSSFAAQQCFSVGEKPGITGTVPINKIAKTGRFRYRKKQPGSGAGITRN